MSTHSVYQPHDDPMHLFLETDPLGDVNAAHSPDVLDVEDRRRRPSPATCARALDLPVVIARMNASYRPNGGLPDASTSTRSSAGNPITTRWDPCTYSPIHQDDINAQTEALLDAAAVPATIVNWAGDEPVSVQEWAAYMGELTGTTPEVVVNRRRARCAARSRATRSGSPSPDRAR